MKKENIHIRATTEEKDILKAKAMALDMSLSEYLITAGDMLYNILKTSNKILKERK